MSVNISTDSDSHSSLVTRHHVAASSSIGHLMSTPLASMRRGWARWDKGEHSPRRGMADVTQVHHNRIHRLN